MMNTPKFSIGRHLEPRSLLLPSASHTPSAAFRSMHESSSKKRRFDVEGLSYRQYRDDGDETFGPYFTPDASLRPPASPYTQSIESAQERIRILETENEVKDDKIFELEKELLGNRKEILKLVGTLQTYRSSTSDLRETIALKDEQLQTAKTLTEKQQSEVTKLNRQLRETLAEFSTRFSVVEEERDRALEMVRELEQTLEEDGERIAVLEAKAKTWNEMENYSRIRNDQLIGTYPPGESLQDSLMEMEVRPAAPVLNLKHLKNLQDSLMEAVEIEKVNLQNEELLGKLKRAEEEISQLIRKLEDAGQQVGQLTVARDELKLKLEDAEGRASQLTVARDELAEKLGRSEEERNQLTVARDELTEKLEKASQLIVARDELIEKLERAGEEKNQLIVAREELTEKLERAEVEVSQLREEVAAARAELEAAKSQLIAAQQGKGEERQFHEIHLEHRKQMAAVTGRLEVANNSWKSSQKKLYDSELMVKKTQFELAKEREEKLKLREEMHRLQTEKFAQNSVRVQELEDVTRGLITQVEGLKVERDRLQMDKRRLLIDYDFLLKRVKASETSSPRRVSSSRPRPAEHDPTERSMAEIIVEARGKSPNRDARRNRPSARYE